jgi:hypothetical protein
MRHTKKIKYYILCTCIAGMYIYPNISFGRCYIDNMSNYQEIVKTDTTKTNKKSLIHKIKMKNKTEKIFIKPDNKVKSILGDTLCNTIFNCKQVKCYELELSKDTANNNSNIYSCFKRINKVVKIDGNYFSIIQQQLLTDSINYQQKSQIRSPFCPLLEFEIMGKNGNRISLLISFSNETWMLVKNGKEILQYQYMDRRTIIRFCQPFISDKKQLELLLNTLK